MKNIALTVAGLALLSASFTTLAAATEVNQQPANTQSMGTISASENSGNLSSLEQTLSEQATENGASSFRIISASGNNQLFGTAEIYK
jgi:multiple stress resistance protein BhsA